jgi:hypothetical protein
MLDRKVGIGTENEQDVVNTTDDTIYLGSAATGLKTGDEVWYENNGGTSIGAPDLDGDTLKDDEGNTKYYVIVGEGGHIKLATSKANADAGTTIDLGVGATGTSHALKRNDKPDLTFNPTGKHYDLTLSDANGLTTGEAVKYDNGGGTDIGGLENGKTYFAIVKDDKLELASSRDKAMSGEHITITGAGTGTEHKIVDATHTSLVTSTSGASAGDIGIAGSVALNIVDVDTNAVIAAGALIAIEDGAMRARRRLSRLSAAGTHARSRKRFRTKTARPARASASAPRSR